MSPVCKGSFCNDGRGHGSVEMKAAGESDPDPRPPSRHAGPQTRRSTLPPLCVPKNEEPKWMLFKILVGLHLQHELGTIHIFFRSPSQTPAWEVLEKVWVHSRGSINLISLINFACILQKFI